MVSEQGCSILICRRPRLIKILCTIGHSW